MEKKQKKELEEGINTEGFEYYMEEYITPEKATELGYAFYGLWYSYREAHIRLKNHLLNEGIEFE